MFGFTKTQLVVLVILIIAVPIAYGTAMGMIAEKKA